MTKFKRTLLTAVAGISVLFAAACGGGDNTSDSVADGEVIYQAPPSTIVIGTAGSGGLYYTYGSGIGELINAELGVTANVEQTGGPDHNIRLIQIGDQDFGMTTTGPAYDAYHGEGDFDGDPHQDFRVVFPMYETPFHWWALANRGITSLDDIKAEGISRVGVGPQGGTSATYLPRIHDILGLNVSSVNSSAGDMISQQQDGLLGVAGFAAGLPIPAVSEISVSEDISLFGIDGEQRDKVIAEFPYFTPYTIKAGTYPRVDHGDIETISQFNFGIVHKTMDIDFVYELVKAYHKDDQARMISVANAAREAVPEAILMNTELPLHPGAIKYYEEIGIELPASVIPAEHK